MSQSTTERSVTGPQFWKSTLDSVLALVLLVLTAPVMILAIVIVHLTSPGPVIYCQTRLGLNGRRYTIFKIRSMYHDCERLTGARWSTPGDSRVTWIGKILRATHIDELPQLFNILRGEMSLVGPRPERPEIVVGLELAIPVLSRPAAGSPRSNRARPGTASARHRPGECAAQGRIRPLLHRAIQPVARPPAHSGNGFRHFANRTFGDFHAPCHPRQRHGREGLPRPLWRDGHHTSGYREPSSGQSGMNRNRYRTLGGPDRSAFGQSKTAGGNAP